MNIKQIVDRLTRKDGKGNFRMYIDHIDIDDLTFGMERLVHRNPPSGVDFYDMLVDIRHACLKDFAVVRNKVWGDIVSLAAAEKSGFAADDMNGYFFVDRGVIRLDRFSINTPQSSSFHALDVDRGWRLGLLQALRQGREDGRPVAEYDRLDRRHCRIRTCDRYMAADSARRGYVVRRYGGRFRRPDTQCRTRRRYFDPRGVSQ